MPRPHRPAVNEDKQGRKMAYPPDIDKIIRVSEKQGGHNTPFPPESPARDPGNGEAGIMSPPLGD